MLTLSIVARMPLAMFSIGLLVHAQRLTGSFAAAGLVTAAYATALGIGGPLLGRLVDRRGQTAILTATAGVSLALLLVIATRPQRRALGPDRAGGGDRPRDATRRGLRADAPNRPARVRGRGVRRRVVLGVRTAPGAGHRRAVLDRRRPRRRGRRA